MSKEQIQIRFLDGVFHKRRIHINVGIEFATSFVKQ